MTTPLRKKMKSIWISYYLSSLVWPQALLADLKNVALNKTATQSTTMVFESSFLHASLALDGNPNPNILGMTCTHTEEFVGTMSTWWMVDLAYIIRIETIAIQNRGDCCGNRLRNLSIQIGKHELGLKERAYFIGPGIDGERYEFQIGGYLGRYVKLEIMNTYDAILTLCEVTVMGMEVERGRIFSKTDGKKNTAKTMDEVGARNTLQCSLQCLDRSNCVASNYDVLNSNCQLQSSSEQRTNAENYKLLSSFDPA